MRWLRIAPVPPPVDVLVRRDGALRSGALQGCAAAGCTMAGTTTTRADLAWIALGASPETIVVPQAPQDPARDQAQFADGSTRVTPLVGVGAGNVVLGIGTFPRAEIAWIYLAPPAAEPGPPVVHRPSPPLPPLEPTRPPQPPQPPPPPQPSQPSGTGTPTGASVCDAQQGMTPGSGALWTGTARMHQWMRGPGFLDEDRADFEVKLREACEVPVLDLSVTPHRRIGTIVWLDTGGTVQHDWRKEEMTGYCLCEGSKTITEPSVISGSFYRRTAAGDSTAALAFDLPARSFYSLTLSTTGTTLEAPCQGETCGGSAGRTLMQFHAGRFPNVSPEASWDPEVRDLESGALSGRYTKALGPATHEVSWSICRAGVPCPPPPEGTGGGTSPPPTEDFDPCGRSGQQAALRDTCHAQLDALLDALAPALAEYNDEMAQAEANRGEFERALEFCKLYDKAKEVLEAILSGGTGPAAEAARALVYLRGVIVKVQNGDLASMLYPAEVAKYLGYYAKAKAIWFEVTASEIEKMQRDLGGCSGKVPIETYLAAKKFLEHFSAAKRVLGFEGGAGLERPALEGTRVRRARPCRVAGLPRRRRVPGRAAGLRAGAESRGGV